MFRLSSVCIVLGWLALGVSTAIAAPPGYDWSAWERIPVLDEGRIKPLDTFADEKVTLITGRSKWTDPKTKQKYLAAELLYNWITAKEAWLKQPVIRCEYRPLRKLLLGEKLEEGTYIAVDDFIDWEESQKQQTFIFRSADAQKRFQEFERLSSLAEAKRPGKPIEALANESAEDRRLRTRAKVSAR